MTATPRLSLALMLLAAATLAAGAVRPELFALFPRIVPDFGVYYAAAQVNAAGLNPYDGDAPEAAQRAIDPKTEPIRATSGPWTVAALTPFAFFDYGAARIAWVALGLAALVFAGGSLWVLYGGAPARAPAGWAFAVSGYAGSQAIGLGQTSLIVLAALVGFVLAERRRRDFLAGLCLGGLLVKPQNQLVFGAVLALWLIDRRRWRVVLGGACGAAALSAVAAAGNPQTFAQYFDSLANRPPADWWPPLPASLLRLALGERRYWLTFVPLLIGTAWAVRYWAGHRKAWDWAERMPLLLLVSYLSSPYGWAYDQVVFLFPLIQLAARFDRGNVVPAMLAGNMALTIYYLTMLKRDNSEFHWVWLAPAALAAYLALEPRSRRASSLSSPSPVRRGGPGG